MAPVFIFARQVQAILKAGKNEIEISEGARISAAAADLIKQNKMRVITASPAAKAPSEEPPSPKTPASETSESRKDDPQDEASEPVRSVEPAPSGDEISDDVVEEIVNRVLARFREIKGPARRTTAPAAKAAAEPAAAPEDDDDLVICRCEEITKGEIKDAIRNGMRTLNGIKRITRAGMGLCQGQTCQKLVTRILTEELGLAAADIDPTTARGPVRPLKLAVFANS
ncbi:MAG: (2Fe-2S)-binding protein [Desulfobacterales bacterium]|nr:MAG: (2Fe-2S)-binding protein [Desulfobacterales bacterium]